MLITQLGNTQTFLIVEESQSEYLTLLDWFLERKPEHHFEILYDFNNAFYDGTMYDSSVTFKHAKDAFEFKLTFT